MSPLAGNSGVAATVCNSVTMTAATNRGSLLRLLIAWELRRRGLGRKVDLGAVLVNAYHLALQEENPDSQRLPVSMVQISHQGRYQANTVTSLNPALGKATSSCPGCPDQFSPRLATSYHFSHLTGKSQSLTAPSVS